MVSGVDGGFQAFTGRRLEKHPSAYRRREVVGYNGVVFHFPSVLISRVHVMNTVTASPMACFRGWVFESDGV